MLSEDVASHANAIPTVRQFSTKILIESIEIILL